MPLLTGNRASDLRCFGHGDDGRYGRRAKLSRPARRRPRYRSRAEGAGRKGSWTRLEWPQAERRGSNAGRFVEHPVRAPAPLSRTAGEGSRSPHEAVARRHLVQRGNGLREAPFCGPYLAHQRCAVFRTAVMVEAKLGLLQCALRQAHRFACALQINAVAQGGLPYAPPPTRMEPQSCRWGNWNPAGLWISARPSGSSG